MKNFSTNTWIIIGVAVVVLVGGAWWLMARDTAENENNDAETNTEEEIEDSDAASAPIDTTTVNTTVSNDASISVADQSAGTTVSVSSVTFAEIGWIAIRDDRGWTLGASRFPAGTHSNVKVELLRGTTAGERYQVLLYVDDGDGAFDLDNEILVTKSDGSVAGAMFTAK